MQAIDLSDAELLRSLLEKDGVVEPLPSTPAELREAKLASLPHRTHCNVCGRLKLVDDTGRCVGEPVTNKDGTPKSYCARVEAKNKARGWA